MKTTTYKTGNVMRSLVVSLIILASLSGIAKGENSGKEAVEAGITLQIASYNANDFAAAEIALETKNWMNGNDETIYKSTESEPALQVEKYNAEEFVAAEMALETQSWLNNNCEVSNMVANVELVPQIEKYNAQDFVEKEMAVETANWMNMQLNHGADDSINCNKNMACK
jgi:hypothetical protein